jgi:hypothetical protein
MTDKQKEIEEINSKILKAENLIKKLKKNIPFAIGGGLIFSFIFPYIPGRRGRKPMIETWEYTNAVIFSLILFFTIYLCSYFYLIDNNKKEIETLKRKVFSIKNNTK